MTINSPDAMPDDDPQVAATEGGEGGGDVPEGQEGVGIGATGEPNTFEPEEDPEASDPETEGQQ
ncbi:hypothetical protein J7E83_11610 [Arthrobacter sp. ISL-48]|uniref:hypothetical protein n=1 Tax=Arthrobacter sp. ISL-48 TaxID=2819110 RepID=UPI001BE6BE5D|nr:hypothetical protein [Arthrobacter sp. ISL-48]MBT2532757.1 hypothetical protein [Arthrobacter sp. ISL-48]